jgi:O-antigen/teichoic acid export membrane protein
MDTLQTLKGNTIIFKAKFFLKDTVLYGIGSTLSKLLYLFTIPLLAKIFTKDQFAIYDLFIALSGFYLIVSIFGQSASAARFINDCENPEEKKKIFSSSLVISFGVYCLLAITTISCRSFILSFLNIDSSAESAQLLHILILNLFFNLIFASLQNFARLFHDTFLYISCTFIQLALYLGITYIYYKFGHKTTIEYAFWAQLISYFFLSIILLYYYKKYFTFSNIKSSILKLLSFGFPYFIMGFMMSLIPILDRYVIIHFLSLSKASEYAIAQKISIVINLILQSIQLSWPAFAYTLYKEKDISKTYNYLFKYIVISCSIIVILISIISPFILHFISPKYETKTVLLIIPILQLTYIFQSLSLISGIGIDVLKKGYLKLSIYFLSFLTYPILLLIFKDQLSLLVISAISLCSKVILWSVKSLLANKISNYKFNIFPSFILLILTLFVCIELQLGNIPLFLISFFSLLLLLGLSVKKDIEIIVNLRKKPLQ